MAPMINVLRFICEWIRVLIKILGPGGVKAVAAENAVLRQQLITMKRSPSWCSNKVIIMPVALALANARLTLGKQHHQHLVLKAQYRKTKLHPR